MLRGWVCFQLWPLCTRTVGRVRRGCLFKKLADHTPAASHQRSYHPHGTGASIRSRSRGLSELSQIHSAAAHPHRPTHRQDNEKRDSVQARLAGVSARISAMLEDHITEAHSEPAPCKYCREKTTTFCKTCSAYVCEQVQCQKRHAKEFGGVH